MARWTGVPMDSATAAFISYGALVLAGLVLFASALRLHDFTRWQFAGVIVPLAILLVPGFSQPGRLPLMVIALISSIVSFFPGPSGRAGLDGVILVVPPLLLRLAGGYPSPNMVALWCAGGFVLGEVIGSLSPDVTRPARRTLSSQAVFGSRGVLAASGLTAIAFALLLGAFITPPAVSVHPGRVIIDHGHGSTEPATRYLGATESLGGNFGHGRLAAKLKAWGYSVTLAEEKLTSECLGSEGVLVLICPSRPYSWAECEAIRAFVAGGGGVLGIGEHTDLDGAMSYLNPVFEPFGLQLACDAVHVPSGTNHHLEFARHPAVAGLREISVSTGASIHGPSMMPLIWTRSGTFSDAGRWQDGRGGVGNRSRDSGEPTGRQVLAACARFGAGKAVLLGDSSYFQNTNLFCNTSFAWQLFGWLSPPHETMPSSRLLLLSVLLIAAVLFLVISASLNPGFSALVLVVSLMIPSYPLFWSEPELSPVQVSPDTPVVALDLAHYPRFDLYYRTLNKKRGIYVDSVCLQMVMNGIEPRLLTGKGWPSSSLSGIRGLIIPPGEAPLDQQEIMQVKGFLERGGRILLVAGRSASALHNGWLLEYGCGVDSEPLWRQFPVYRPDGLVGRFAGPPYEASYSGGHPLLEEVNRVLLDIPRVISGGTPFLSLEGFPVGIQRTVGAGELTIIGDEECMLDEHLEDSRGVYDTDKITLWRNLLANLAGGGSP